MFDIVPVVWEHITGTIDIGMNQMKKPFKVDATYKLDEDCVANFIFTNMARSQCEKYYGKRETAFTMRVVEILPTGNCHCVMKDSDNNCNTFTVWKGERDLFTRLDNK